MITYNFVILDISKTINSFLNFLDENEFLEELWEWCYEDDLWDFIYENPEHLLLLVYNLYSLGISSSILILDTLGCKGTLSSDI